jgi:hypothetical protein
LRLPGPSYLEPDYQDVNDSHRHLKEFEPFENPPHVARLSWLIVIRHLFHLSLVELHGRGGTGQPALAEQRSSLSIECRQHVDKHFTIPRKQKEEPGELQQISAGGIVGLVDDGRGVLLHLTVRRGVLRTVTLVVDRGAIRHPVGPPTRGLLALLMSRLGCFTVSNRAARRHCPLTAPRPGRPLRVSTVPWLPRGRCEPQIRAPEPDGQEHPLGGLREFAAAPGS